MAFRARWNLPRTTLLVSSGDRGWSGLGAELRRHIPGEIPEMVAQSTVIAVAIRGNADATIHRRGNGEQQVTPMPTGAIWLCPRGVEEDSIRITRSVPEMLHLYLPDDPFAALSRTDGWPEVDSASVRYDAGFQDPVISGLANAVRDELLQPSSSGEILVETAALTLAAWLLHARSRRPTRRRGGGVRPLDRIRLARVIDHIENAMGSVLTLESMATVACLSQFHFARAFRAATGQSPHQYVAARRLQLAQRLLTEDKLSIAEVAFACSFDTQAGFTRAFRRATGLSPAGFRRSKA